MMTGLPWYIPSPDQAIWFLAGYWAGVAAMALGALLWRCCASPRPKRKSPHD